MFSRQTLLVREVRRENMEGLLFFALDEGHAKRLRLHWPGAAESFMELPGSLSKALGGMTWAAP